jgi:hypothetical protein
MKTYLDKPLTPSEAWDKVMNEGVIVTAETDLCCNFPQYQKGLGGVDVIWQMFPSETIPNKDVWMGEFNGEKFYVTENEKRS